MEADWLVALAIGANRLSELTGKVFDQKDIQKIDAVLSERIKGKPLAYIIGNTEFYKRVFEVNSNVLIPRPETELLVQKVIEEIMGMKSEVCVLDLCSGSGAIGITISLETNAKVTCSDISDGAIETIKVNMKNLNANVEVICSDLFEKIDGKFDIIVSNPPYIKSLDILQLDREVKDFEPHLALDGGESGLVFYEKIIQDAPNFLNKGGKLFFEIGIEQSGDIVSLMEKEFEDIKVLKDYNNIDRIIIGKLR